MERPLISVIVPIYKVENYIHQCVESILNQTYDNIELILVDDGSPCRCPQICDEFAERDSRVIVIHQPNRGVSAARNNALDVCKGDYIAFVDGDDWLEPTAYEEMLERMLSNDLDVVFCTANIIVNNEVVEKRFEYFDDNTKLEPSKLVELSLTDEIGGQPWMKMWNRKCWENVRFPIGRIYEDLAVSFRPFVYAKKNVGFLKKPLYNYRLNPNGLSLSRNSSRAFQIFLAFRDHFDYAKESCRSVYDVCLVKTMNAAISMYNRQITHVDEWDDSWVAEVRLWLKTNERQIMKSQRIKKLKKISVWLLIHCQTIYRSLYSIYYPFSNRGRKSK